MTGREGVAEEGSESGAGASTPDNGRTKERRAGRVRVTRGRSSLRGRAESAWGCAASCATSGGEGPGLGDERQRASHAVQGRSQVPSMRRGGGRLRKRDATPAAKHAAGNTSLTRGVDPRVSGSDRAAGSGRAREVQERKGRPKPHRGAGLASRSKQYGAERGAAGREREATARPRNMWLARRVGRRRCSSV